MELGKAFKQPPKNTVKNQEKGKKCWRGDDVVDKDGAGIGLPGYTNASHPSERVASTSVPWYTNASLLFPLFFL